MTDHHDPNIITIDCDYGHSFCAYFNSLSTVRTAFWLEQSPPNQVLISLDLFLTFFYFYSARITQQRVETDSIRIYNWRSGISSYRPAIYTSRHQNSKKGFGIFTSIAKVDLPKELQCLPLRIIIPDLMISESKRSFEIGFLTFLPSLIIDIVVASALMATGMMMMPPVMVALPFKITFFVLVDRWCFLAGSFVQSFVT